MSVDPYDFVQAREDYAQDSYYTDPADVEAVEAVEKRNEYEAVVTRLVSELSRHHELGPFPFTQDAACTCGWMSPEYSYLEHVAATLAARRPWEPR